MKQGKSIEMIELKEKLKKIKSLIPEGSEVHYFDYPVHSNIGDMLIWKGTEEFFKENNIKVQKRYSFHLVSRQLAQGNKVSVPKNCTIICHGGGNFGDLYPVHQVIRKLLVEHYPNHRIIILPQTIYYKAEVNMKKDFNLLSGHKDLHFFVRDEKSFNIANKFLENVYLSPDMAHTLYPIKTDENIGNEALYFLRQDIENNSEQYIYIDDNSNIFDWDLLYNNEEFRILKFLTMLHSSSKLSKIVPRKIVTKLWYMFVKHMIDKAVNLYNQHEKIITSRLHGHILAALMEKENKLIDNSYGKNSSYYNLWTKDIKNTELLD